MYVRRWPRISASSRMPPSDMRTNSRPIARAMDSPIEVLPVPGGPIRVRIAPDFLSAWIPRSSRSFLTATYSTMRSLTSSRPAWSASSTSRVWFGSRRSSERADHGTEISQSRYVRIIEDSPLDSPMRSRRPSSRSACSRTASGMPASSIFARYSSTNEPSSSPSSRRIDSICLRSTYSRCCLPAPSSTSSRMRRRTCSSARRSRWKPHGRLEALGDVGRLEELDLLLEGQVGGVARGVGERAGLLDGAQPVGDAAVVAALLEDLLDGRAVLALELTGAPVDGDVVGVLDDLDAEAAGGIGVGGAGDAARDALEVRAAGAAGEADLLGDAGDRPDAGVFALMPRDEQHTVLVAGVDGEGDIHRREDDGVVERDEEKR